MKKSYDAVIVGGGPAGLSAAIYMARAQYQVLVIEKEKIGGQITITSEVVNYPGVLVTDGKKLTESMRIQAENFGAEFLMAEVTDIDLDTDIRKIQTSRGEIETLGIILATGANPRKVGFAGETEFMGKGVAYCATCDGEFFTGLDVFVIGGGFAAAEEAIFLTKYAKKVTVMVRGEVFSCAGSIVDEVMQHPQIEVCFQTEIKEAGGDESLKYALFYDKNKQEEIRYEPESGKTFGIFVFAGYAPATSWMKPKLALDEQGYLLTDMNQKTNIEGVYGAGDVCVKKLRQVVTAVSDGAVAATSLEKYISSMYERLGLERQEKLVHTRTVMKNQTEEATEQGGSFISDAMRAQLQDVFARFENSIILKGYLDERKVSHEVKGFLEEVSKLTDKVSVQVIGPAESIQQELDLPAIAVCDSQGEYLGAQFHGVPGGHEFNSFIIAMYNAAGPGQLLAEEDQERIRKLDQKLDLKIIVSLSCTMCPEVVMGAQKIALENPNIEAQMYDIQHFPEWKERFNIMSVPCLIVNDKEVRFGKKSISEILDILEKEE